ncbi:MAG: UDP-N-acetylmuramoyl-L-alanine--D-glutamate ligase [Alphaproteobacteria bacterium]|nr:UDP-N-acetylmuramoyl-L-alanine--D-glutamate ligase [Alphaproteobacteria bacterium]
MIPLEKYSDKGVAILGLGKTGRAAVNAFDQAGANPLLAWDDNPTQMMDLPPHIRTYSYDQIEWEKYDLLLSSPGIPRCHPMTQAAEAAGCIIKSDIEILWESIPHAKYVGITGTNGKSTTTELISHILSLSNFEFAAGGNLGQPALSLPNLNANATYLLEVSSYQLALTQDLTFDIAVLLNISEDHLEMHGSFQSYIKLKKKIFNQGRLATAIICTDDENSKSIYEEICGYENINCVEVTTSKIVNDGISIIDGLLHENGKAVLDLTKVTRLKGAHNWQNAGASWAVARNMKVPIEKIYRAFSSFPGLAHRMEFVATIDGISFINDSKATNFAATARALSSFENIFWVAGGRSKLGSSDIIHDHLNNIKAAFIYGECADKICNDINKKVKVTKFSTLKEAVSAAMDCAKNETIEDKVVLFSPACSSFDQFVNFEARGDEFKKLVNFLDHQYTKSARRGKFEQL